MTSKFVTRKVVVETLGIHYQTVYNMVRRGELEIIKVGRNNMYNLEKYLKDKGLQETSIGKEHICYCRVSSRKQKPDLDRQIEFMKNKYPNHRVISDIGSGMNYNRSGLQEIINMGIRNQVAEVVIVYKDRLARFGFELIENILMEHSSAKIKILNNDECKTQMEELSEDILSIMNVYVAKINGLRKYNDKTFKKNKKIMA
jgi:putative resolvase